MRTTTMNTDDDSTNNANAVSTPATAISTPATSAGNCNSSDEPASSDSDHRGPTEDIISHLNMLSMQDGLGFNGFGLLGAGTPGGGHGWTPPTMASVSPLGNGLNKQMPNFGSFHDPQQLSVASYIEALKMQQHLQLQRVKAGGLPNDMVSSFFTGSAAVTPNIFGNSLAPIPGLQQNSQPLRRPIFGAAGGGEAHYSGPYNNFLMNRAPVGINFPPPMDFGTPGKGRALGSNHLCPSTANDSNRKFHQHRSNVAALKQQQEIISAAQSLPLLNFQHQLQPSIGSPFGNRVPLYANGLGGDGRCRARPQPQNCQSFPASLLQHQNLRPVPNPAAISPTFGAPEMRVLNSSLSDVSSLSSGASATQIFSRKVFLGGLPPDIDEAPYKRPSPTTPSSVNTMMIPSNLSVANVLPQANQAAGRSGTSRRRSNSGQEIFSRKVFVGGLPMDISEDEICSTFLRFGPVSVDWPHKAESKSYMPPKGYAFLIFFHENSVQMLIDSCTQKEEGRYYIWVNSPTMRKEVQIRPWRLSDADFVLDANLALDPRKTVFVGGVPRPLRAVELAATMERYFGGVCYTGIDTDPELKYPKGAGRVSFSNQQSYIAAISERFVRLDVGGTEKRVEIKPYVLDDQMCDECGGARCAGRYAPYFCANVSCLQYYCELCWQTIHSKSGRDFHKPLVKEGSDRPRAVPFRGGL